jgi:hypothetical protein
MLKSKSVDFSTNLDLFKSFEDDFPEFWNYLSRVAIALSSYRSEKGDILCIDDHFFYKEDRSRLVEMIGFCYNKTCDGKLAKKGDYNSFYPPAWCFYYIPHTICQSKNSFQVLRDKAHIVTTAIGANIVNSDFSLLNSGCLLEQPKYNKLIECTFILPVEMFLNVFFEIPNLSTLCWKTVYKNNL